MYLGTTIPIRHRAKISAKNLLLERKLPSKTEEEEAKERLVLERGD